MSTRFFTKRKLPSLKRRVALSEGINIRPDNHTRAIIGRRTRRFFRLLFQFPAEQAEDFVELALHGDHLFAHVKGDLGAF